MIILIIMVLSEEDIDAKSFSLHRTWYILSTWLITLDLDLDQLAEIVFFLGFSTGKLLFSHLIILDSMKGSHYVLPNLRNSSYELIILVNVSEHLHKLFEIALRERFNFFQIHLLNYLFLLVWTLGYLFYNLDYNPLLHYLFCSSC